MKKNFLRGVEGITCSRNLPSKGCSFHGLKLHSPSRARANEMKWNKNYFLRWDGGRGNWKNKAMKERELPPPHTHTTREQEWKINQ